MSNFRNILSPWYLDPGAARLRSVNGADGLVTATLAGDDATRAGEAAAIASHFRSASGPVTVAVTGTDVLAAETSHLTERGLLRAELLAFPIVLLLLGLYLRRALLALVPVAAGVLAVLSGLMLLGAVAAVTPVTSTATNLVVGLALGLCIDYALLLMTRYREELRAGRDRDDALAAAVRRAGRTIVFSAATLAISLAALALFPVPFLRSMAIGGLGATLFAAACSLIVVPALLAALGDRVPARASARPRHAPGWWYRFAAGVMRRPAAVALPVLAVLAVLLLPVAHLHLGINDDRVLPASDPARQGAQVLRAAFDGRETSPLQVVATGAPRLNISPAALDRYAARLSAVRGVARVEASAGTFTAGRRTSGPGPGDRRMRAANAAYLDVIPAVEPLSAAGSQLVTDVRAVPAPAPVLVGGPAADRVDLSAAITSRLPVVLGLIAAVDLPGRAPGRPARVHPDRLDHRPHPDPGLLRRLRAVDGLLHVRALPHQGGTRPKRGPDRLGGRRPGPHRPDHHLRRRPGRGGLRRVRRLRRRPHQAPRPRPGHRRAARRVRHPLHPAARRAAPRRARGLVVTCAAGPAAPPDRAQRNHTAPPGVTTTAGAHKSRAAVAEVNAAVAHELRPGSRPGYDSRSAGVPQLRAVTGGRGRRLTERLRGTTLKRR